MKLIATEEKVLQDILEKLKALEAKLETKSIDSKERWLTNQEFCILLDISKRTAQNYRDKGLIAYAQIGSKVYYRLADVHQLLEKHTKVAFNISNLKSRTS